jgi:Tfp pilus assembly protein PilF
MKKIAYILILLFPSCVVASLFHKKTAETYFEKGKVECANTNTYVGINFLTKAIKMNPNYEEAYMERAKAYQMIDSTEKAVSDYEVLIFLAKNNQEQRGKLYLLIGNTRYINSEDSLACLYWRMARDMNNTSSWDKIRKYCK